MRDCEFALIPFFSGAYFWGSFVTTLPAGVLAERFGAKIVTLIALFFSAILTALTPLSADLHFYVIYANRFLVGGLGVRLITPVCCSTQLDFSTISFSGVGNFLSSITQHFV